VTAAAHIADPRHSGPSRDDLTAADRSSAVPSGSRTVRSWPLLVLAAPAAAEVWSGWVGIAQKTGFGLVSPLPGILPSLRLDTSITLPVGVEAYAAYALRAWLADGNSVSDRTRRFAKWSAICSFGARHGRSGRLPPAGPSRGGTGAVARHHDRVLPAGPGPGHGDRAGPHAPRRRSHDSRRTGPRRDHRTSRVLVLWVVHGVPGRTGPGPQHCPAHVRVRSPSRQDQNGPRGGPERGWRDQDAAPARDRPGTPDRQQAFRSGKARIAACPA
jgi:hypothetical protein